MRAIKDEAFLIDDITLQNITEISKKQSYLEEMRICELSELALSAASLAVGMISDGYGIYEILSLISDTAPFDNEQLHDEMLYENRERLSAFIKNVRAQDKAFFAELFIRRVREKGIYVTERDFLFSHKEKESFTYVKNPLADEAYDVFSQEFSSPTVSYSKSLQEAVRAVKDGKAEYCLLPLEEKGGARLSAVSELIFREDLKINSVIPVFGIEGNADMKYALVAKNFLVPEIDADDDRYLEIRVPRESNLPISDLFVAAEALGLSLYRVNTISYTTENGESQHYSVVLRDEKKDFVFLLTYLTLFSREYTPIGIYKNLE